ncbi:MAG: post-transcriptional regulator [Aerococcus sp.]|nr:post-transcriptional regulator [Aerococcus sp.]
MTLTKWQRLALWPDFAKKARQFQREGYSAISAKDIATYFEAFGWKHGVPETLKDRKQAIVHLTPNRYFDYEQIEATSFNVPDLEDIDWDKLLK